MSGRRRVVRTPRATLREITGDASRPADRPVVIVHVCNDRGGWGKGFTGAISRRWKEPERHFRAWHKSQEGFELGAVRIVEAEEGLWVANLIGQSGYRRVRGQPPVRYNAIRTGLEAVATFCLEQKAEAHMPRIGCGLAGGTWDEVGPIVQKTLVKRGVNVVVYDLPAKPDSLTPQADPAARIQAAGRHGTGVAISLGERFAPPGRLAVSERAYAVFADGVLHLSEGDGEWHEVPAPTERAALLALPAGFLLMCRQPVRVDIGGVISPRFVQLARGGGSSWVQLADGNVLSTGGEPGPMSYDDRLIDHVAILDVKTGTWTPQKFMPVGRVDHSMLLLHDGSVLCWGGEAQTKRSRRYEETSAWKLGKSGWTKLGPAEGQAVLATTGHVVFDRGMLYDPRNQRITEVEGIYRDPGPLIPLADGRVLKLGGEQCEVFSTARGSWSPAPPLPCSDALVSPDGSVLARREDGWYRVNIDLSVL